VTQELEQEEDLANNGIDEICDDEEKGFDADEFRLEQAQIDNTTNNDLSKQANDEKQEKIVEPVQTILMSVNTDILQTTTVPHVALTISKQKQITKSSKHTNKGKMQHVCIVTLEGYDFTNKKLELQILAADAHTHDDRTTKNILWSREIYANSANGVKNSSAASHVIEETFPPSPIIPIQLYPINVKKPEKLSINTVEDKPRNGRDLPTPPITPNRSRSSTQNSEHRMLSAGTDGETSDTYMQTYDKSSFASQDTTKRKKVWQEHSPPSSPEPCMQGSSAGKNNTDKKTYRHSIQPIRLNRLDLKNDTSSKQKAGSIAGLPIKERPLSCRDTKLSTPMPNYEKAFSLPRLTVTRDSSDETVNPYSINVADPLTRKVRRSHRAASASNALGVGDEERELILQIEHERRLEWEEKLERWKRRESVSGSGTSVETWEVDSGYGSMNRTLQYTEFEPETEVIEELQEEDTPWSGGWGSGTGAHDIPYVRPASMLEVYSMVA